MVSYSVKMLVSRMAVVLLSACGSAPKYACKPSLGLGCISVRGVYDKLNSGELEGKGSKRPTKIRSRNANPEQGQDITAEGTLVSADAPVYVAPKVMRIWIGTTADKNGVFHSQSYVYKVVSKGSWLNQEKESDTPVARPATYYSSIHEKR